MSNDISLKEIFKQNQEKFLFALILIVAILISFQAGMLKERERKSADLKVILSQKEEMSREDKEALVLGRIVQRKDIVESVQKTAINKQVKQENCAFIGSKNSDKYHTPDCHWAERIKEENRVCFESKEEAQEKGYQPGSCNK